MKILLISSRYLPIFNKENKGAIQKLEQIYLKYNESTSDSFTVYSPKIATDNYDHRSLKNTTFRAIDQTTLKYRVTKYLYATKRITLHQPNSEAYIRTIARDIIKKNEQDSYDLIVFENGEQDIPIFKKLTKTKTRVALHLHNDYLNIRVKNSRKIIESCNEIWVVSNFLAKQVNSVKKIKTITIPNTIDAKSFKLNSKIIKALAKKYDINHNKIFIFVGRILKEKGILQLIKAFDIYNTIEPNSKLLIIGAVEKNRKSKRLQKSLTDHCLKNKNIHHLGYLKPEKIANYQAIADCQIIPSMCEEAFGLVILEAMSSNLKIIASKSGGIPEVGEDRITYINRKTVIKDLVKEMQKVDKQAKLPKKHYQEILDRYSVENFCKNMHGAIHGKKK